MKRPGTKRDKSAAIIAIYGIWRREGGDPQLAIHLLRKFLGGTREQAVHTLTYWCLADETEAIDPNSYFTFR